MSVKLNKKHQKNLRTRARIREKNQRIKNKKRKYMLYYIFFAIIILSVTMILSLTAFFKIEQVKIKNTDQKITNQQILKCIELNYGDNLIRFDSKKALNRLLKTWPSISYAEIIKTFPNTLEILCKFDLPIFFIETNNAKLIGIAKSGRAVKLYENFNTIQNQNIENKLILKIKTPTFKPPKLGEFLNIPQKEQQTLQNIVDLINQTSLEDITKIEINNNLEINLTYQNKIEIEIQNISKTKLIILSAKEIIKNQIDQNSEGKIQYFEKEKTIHFIPKHSNF